MSTNRAFTSSSNIVNSCKYHIVWCPKYRRKVLVDEIAVRLKTIIRETAAEMQVEIIEMEITPALACGSSVPDHVHLLCEIHPQYSVNLFMQLIKGHSSRLLRQENKSLCTCLPTLWTTSYFISNIGGAPLEKIKQYIENQKRV